MIIDVITGACYANVASEKKEKNNGPEVGSLLTYSDEGTCIYFGTCSRVRAHTHTRIITYNKLIILDRISNVRRVICEMYVAHALATSV